MVISSGTDWIAAAFSRRALYAPEEGTGVQRYLAMALIAGAAALAVVAYSATSWAAGPPQAAPEEGKTGAQQPAGGSKKPATSAKKKKPVQVISILMVRQKRETLPPLSLLDLRPDDDGVGGAKLAISDNNTTGRFVNQEFRLDEIENTDTKELVAETVNRVDAGIGFIVADVEPTTLLKLADALKTKSAIIFNAGAPDDRLRGADCRSNVLHTASSRAMLTDALSQYLAWKRWRKWFLIVGPSDNDKLMASSFKRSAKRYGQKIVEERTFEYNPGSRRSDGGFEQIQKQIPSFTQNAAEHDVVVVADEGDLFGDYFPYRTWDARPVTGTTGLYPTSWHPAVETWGATQFQNRFIRMNKRRMRPLDYDVWMAVRAVGEAATRTNSNSPEKLIAYMQSPDFELAAFKGQKLTFRDWNGQLRQPILLTTAKLHVTFSPQPGFLHQFSELDTLGIDKPESTCKDYVK